MGARVRRYRSVAVRPSRVQRGERPAINKRVSARSLTTRSLCCTSTHLFLLVQVHTALLLFHNLLQLLRQLYTGLTRDASRNERATKLGDDGDE